jgi:hypothetical protein
MADLSAQHRDLVPQRQQLRREGGIASARSASQPNTRTMIRYSSRTATHPIMLQLANPQLTTRALSSGTVQGFSAPTAPPSGASCRLRR